MKKQKIRLIPVMMFILLTVLIVPVNAASKKVVKTEKVEMETNEEICLQD